MAALTWRNVDAPQLDTRGIALAGQNITQSFDRMGQMLMQREAALRAEATNKALAAGMATRHVLQRKSARAVGDFVALLKPWSVVGLIATVVLLFGFQAGTIVAKPLVIAMIAVPLVLQSYGIFFIGWWGARLLKLPHNQAGPACLIGTSNFFELAVAVAISLFGLNSGAALATVVGVLVEVPVMLSLVALVNAWQPGWERTRH